MTQWQRILTRRPLCVGLILTLCFGRACSFDINAHEETDACDAGVECPTLENDNLQHEYAKANTEHKQQTDPSQGQIDPQTSDASEDPATNLPLDIENRSWSFLDSLFGGSSESDGASTEMDDNSPSDDIQQTRTRNDAPPVIMIPSFAGTRLRTWSNVNCGLKRGFQVGGAIWLDARRMLTQTSCWINCLKLVPHSQDDDLCVTRPDEGLDAITQVDEQLPTGFLWKDAIHMLASLGYEPGKTMLAFPYDWRLAPAKMEERDRSFSRLKLQIERAVREFKERNPHSPIRGVFMVAFSMGNLVLQYFFRYLESELGKKGMERWTNEHISVLLMGGAPLLGSTSPVDSLLGGETVGLPMTKEQSRDMYLTWGSWPIMMPYKPKSPNKRHIAMNHGEDDFPARVVQVTNKDGIIFNPENDEITTKDGWLGQIGDERLSLYQELINKWHVDDPLIFGENGVNTPWTPPNGIDHIIAAYGINVPTPVGHVFEEDASNPGFFKKLDDIVNVRGEVRSSATGKHALPTHQRYPTRKSGDGTVDYFSLSWAHSWFGEEVVNITRVPSNRKYEDDEVERFENVDVFDPKQLSATQRVPHGYNTFYTRRWIEGDKETGLRPRSIQVWEFDGIGHRDSVTHPLFLRLWKGFLHGATMFSRIYVGAQQRAKEQMWTDIDKSGALDGFRNDYLCRLSQDGGLEGPSGKVPTSDQDCFWNYAEVRCDRPRYCEYQYRVGDVHLSQSCRLRDTPLDKDDPSLLLRDAVAHNVSYPVGPGKMEWQTIYRSHDPRLLRPWVQLALAFMGGALALALLIYLVIRYYGLKNLLPPRSKPRKRKSLRKKRSSKRQSATQPPDLHKTQTI